MSTTPYTDIEIDRIIKTYPNYKDQVTALEIFAKKMEEKFHKVRAERNTLEEALATTRSMIHTNPYAAETCASAALAAVKGGAQ